MPHRSGDESLSEGLWGRSGGLPVVIDRALARAMTACAAGPSESIVTQPRWEKCDAR
jgi:hypothetical protein